MLPDLKPHEVGITIIVLLWIVKQLFDLIKNKKEPAKQFECHAESKDVTDVKAKQTSDQHDKMIETLGTMTTSLALMNETIQGTNGKAARIERGVDSIKQSIN